MQAIDITGIVFALIVLTIPLGALARLIGCAVSPEVRKRVKDSPYLHLAWGVIAITVAAIVCIPFSPDPPPRNAKARFTSRAIVVAIKAFHADYRRYPLQASSAHDHAYNDDQRALTSILTGNPGFTNENPRKIMYMDRDWSPNGTFVDGWHRPFHVVADWNMNGELLIGKGSITNTVVAWSNGKNGVNEFGEGDDIASWK